MLQILVFLAAIFSTSLLSAQHHKIQIVLTNPRSVSTALEKSMMTRGDHKVLHEPWVASYMYHHDDRAVFNELPPLEFINAKNYSEVKDLIFKYAEERPVFLKDMIWCMAEEFLSDDALLSDPDVILTILIREPALSLESFFNKASDTWPKEEVLQFTPDVMRYDALVAIAEKYHEIRGIWPIIMEAEDLCRNPQGTMKSFCEQAGIPYMEDALSWEQRMPEEWKHLASWHKDAAASKGFFVPERDGFARFTMTQPEYVAPLEAIYQQIKPYYEKLKKLKVQ